MFRHFLPNRMIFLCLCTLLIIVQSGCMQASAPPTSITLNDAASEPSEGIDSSLDTAQGDNMEAREQQVNPEREAIGYGRYIETVHSLPGGEYAVALAETNGRLYVAGQKEEAGATNFYRLSDGEFTPLGITLDEGVTIYQMAALPDGRIALVGGTNGDLEAQKATMSASMSASDGAETSRRVPVLGLYIQDDGHLVKTAELDSTGPVLDVTEGGNLLLGHFTALMEFDANGNEVSAMSILSDVGALEAGTLYGIDVDQQLNARLTRHTYPAYEEQDSVALDASMAMGSTVMHGDGAGGLYLANSQGLFHLNQGGSKLEMLVEGMSCALGDPKRSVRRLCATPDGTAYVLTYETDGTGFYSYRWDDEAPIYAQTQLSIVSVSSSYLLTSAIAMYTRKNPDVTISYRSYVSLSHTENLTFNSSDEIENARIQMEDAVRNINTELMSGNAPDIFIMDDMPIVRYADRGYLDDMSGWVASRTGGDAILPNIASGYLRSDGTLPCVPLMFSVPVLVGDKAQVTSVNSVSDLVQAAQNPVGKQLMGLQSERSLLLKLLPVYIAEITDASGKVQMTQENLTAFLSGLAAIQAALPAADESEGNSTLWDDVATGASDMMLRDLGQSDSGEISAALLYYAGKDPWVQPLPGLSQGVAFAPDTIVAVSAASGNKDVAYDFLDELFSVEAYEAYDNTWNYPSTQAALDLAIEAMAQGAQTFPVATVNGNAIHAWPLENEAMWRVQEILSSADTPVTVDYGLMAMVIEECTLLLRGNATAESVAADLYGRIRAYLEE